MGLILYISDGLCIFSKQMDFTVMVSHGVEIRILLKVFLERNSI